VIIIIAVYLPIFTLQGMEGRMFRPMAITVCSALFGSLLLALTLAPALSSYLLRPARHHEGAGWFERIREGYRTSLDRVLERRGPILVGAAVMLAAAIGSFHF